MAFCLFCKRASALASIKIARIIITPFVTHCQKELTIDRFNKLLITPKIMLPIIAPTTLAFPPFKDVPPITAAAIASISRPFACSTKPAQLFRQNRKPPPHSHHAVPVTSFIFPRQNANPDSKKPAIIRIIQFINLILQNFKGCKDRGY